MGYKIIISSNINIAKISSYKIRKHRLNVHYKALSFTERRVGVVESPLNITYLNPSCIVFCFFTVIVVALVLA